MADKLANTIPLLAINASIAAQEPARVTADLSRDGSEIRSLTHAIVEGNEEAFGRFYDQYQGRIYGLLLVMVSGREDSARELHQQVMIKVARRFRAFDREPQLWAWLSEVARNVFRDYLRAESRRLKRNLSASVDGAEENLSQTDENLLNWLEEALHELDQEERLLINAAYFENRSQEQTGRPSRRWNRNWPARVRKSGHLSLERHVMNPEDLRTQQRLLNDVLSEPSPGRTLGSKETALAAFRRARTGRRVRRFSAAAVILALVLGAIYQHNGRSGSASQRGDRANKQQPASESADSVPRLTDQELIASFPSNSCFLAEVNGRQVLVFMDPTLKEKFISTSEKPIRHHSF